MSTIENDVNGHLTTWNPMKIFDCQNDDKYAIVVLNRPIFLEKSVLLPMWEKAQVTITVDGGTDRWIEYLGDLSDSLFNGKSNPYVPTMITGDLDSVSSDTLDKFRSVGVKVVRTKDQSLTDYTKALVELAKHCDFRNIKLNAVYVIVDASGRFDHIIGNINTLYKSPKIIGDVQVIQVANDSLTWLLRPGKHRIIIPDVLVTAKGWCGLVPFGKRVDKISTTGLKWNLDNLMMEFGGLISTSNTYENNCKQVTINTNENLIWTMGIETMMKNFHKS